MSLNLGENNFLGGVFISVDPQLKCEGLQLATENSVFLSAQVPLDNSDF